MTGYYLEAPAAAIRWCADLDEVDDGTEVRIWKLPSYGEPVRRLMYHDTLPLPLHAAADEVQRVLNRLESPDVILGSSPSTGER